MTSLAARPSEQHAGRLEYDLLACCVGTTTGVVATTAELQLAARLEFVPARPGEQKRTFRLVQDGTFTWLETHPCIDLPRELPLQTGAPTTARYTLSRARTKHLTITAHRAEGTARGVGDTVAIGVTHAGDPTLELLIELTFVPGSDRGRTTTRASVSASTASWQPGKER